MVRFHTFNSFTRHTLPHGVFMRHGGVSPSPWKSLNLGGENGDLRENVIENRRRVFHAIGKPVESLYDVWQVHSDVIIHVDRPRPLSEPQIKADALLTNQPTVTLFMRFADCVPIFLFDPIHKVVGMVHAGWQGTVKRIVTRTIAEMQKQYQTRPQDVYAGIGPSICVDHYEVQKDVVDLVSKHLGVVGMSCVFQKNGRNFFNLQKANTLQLNQVGVENIEQSMICTACHVNDWFSHRAESGNTGRFGALIAL